VYPEVKLISLQLTEDERERAQQLKQVFTKVIWEDRVDSPSPLVVGQIALYAYIRPQVKCGRDLWTGTRVKCCWYTLT